MTADERAGVRTLGKTREIILPKTDFTKSALTFEPLQLQGRETAHFEALEQLFLTVPNMKRLELQERIRKPFKIAIAHAVKRELSYIREAFTICTMRLTPTRPPDNYEGNEDCLSHVKKRKNLALKKVRDYR